MLPVGHVVMDQENRIKETFSCSGKTISGTATPLKTPKRTPLGDVTRSVSKRKSVAKPVYSQITPAQTPVHKTPRRKSTKVIKQAPIVFHEDEVPEVKTESSETCSTAINTLVYNKVVDILAKAQVEFDQKLQEKDNEIAKHKEKIEELENLNASEKEPDNTENEKPTKGVMEDQLNDYKRLYECSQQNIKELEAEILEYAGLMETIEKAEKVQESVGLSIEEGFQHVQKLSEKVLAQKALLEDERKQWEIKICQNDQLTQESVNKGNKLQEELKEITEKLKKAECDYNLLEGMYKNMCEELMGLTGQITDITVEKEGLQQENAKLKDEIEDFQYREQEHFLEKQTLQAAMLVQEREIKTQSEISSKSEERLKAVITDMEIKCQRCEQVAVNLQRTLDNREEENDHLESNLTETKKELREYQEKSDQQMSTIADQKREIEENRNLKKVLERYKKQMQSVQAQAKETQDFLEQEHATISEALKETEEKYTITQLELTRCQTALNEKESECVMLEFTVRRLNETLQTLQEELDNVKSNAHYMLVTQCAELSDSESAVGMISDQIMLLLSDLEGKLAEFSEVENQLLIDDHQSTTTQELMMSSLPTPLLTSTLQPTSTMQSTSTLKPKSLVSSILSAVKSAESGIAQWDNRNPDHGHIASKSNQENATLEARMKDNTSETSLLLGSSSSAFTRVAVASVSNNTSSSSQEVGMPHKENTELIEEDIENPLDESADISESDISLVSRIAAVSKLLNKAIRIVTTLQSRLSAENNDLKQENKNMKAELKKQCSSYEDHLSSLQGQVRDLERHVKHQQNEIQQKKAEIQRCCEAREYSKSKMNEMAENLARFCDQQAQLQKMSEEIATLQQHLSRKETELLIVQEELNGCLKRLDEMHAQDGFESREGHHIRENLRLKQEIGKVRLKMVEKQEEWEKAIANAKRKITIFQSNWEKADKEVYRLDDLLERIRQALHQHQEFVAQNEDMKAIVTDLGWL